MTLALAWIWRFCKLMDEWIDGHSFGLSPTCFFCLFVSDQIHKYLCCSLDLFSYIPYCSGNKVEKEGSECFRSFLNDEKENEKGRTSREGVLCLAGCYLVDW